MKHIKIVLIALLAIVSFIPQGLAITVDGVKSPGEWNEDWGYGQDRNDSHSAVFPYGDRMEVEQGKVDTGIVNMEDPSDDSGPGYDETMATVGPYKSGFDIKRMYAHFDPETNTLYGMTTVYGIPGDLDGDGDISENCIGNGDCEGDPGPGGLVGVGTGETVSITFTQGTKVATVIVGKIKGQNNDWRAGLELFEYDDVNISYANDQDAVFEMAIHNVNGKYFDISPGAEDLVITLTAGGIEDIPGEDSAQITMCFPGVIGDFVWYDGWCNESNGVQDLGETGLAGVKVSLYDHGGDTSIRDTTTDANGYYYFDWLKPGCYDIVIDPPTGLNEVTPNAGPDDVDSDVINNRIDNVCLTSDNMVDLTNDFGYCETYPVPALTPFGLMVMAGLLGIIGILGIRIKR
jgi:hypothetical protein